MQRRLACRMSVWPSLLLCLLVVVSWSERNTAQAHINITWADNTTDSFPTMDFLNHRIPYYEKQGTLLYWGLKIYTCEYMDMSDVAKDILKDHLARTGKEQDVAVLVDRNAASVAGCKTIVEVGPAT